MFFGFIFVTFFGAPFHGFWGPKLTPKFVQNWFQNESFFFVSIWSPFFRSLNSLRTLFCSLLGLLGPSWGVSRAKTCRQSYAKTTFLKIVFFGSWGSIWLSSAPLDASGAGHGAKMAPKMAPTATPKVVRKVVQNWT